MKETRVARHEDGRRLTYQGGKKARSSHVLFVFLCFQEIAFFPFKFEVIHFDSNVDTYGAHHIDQAHYQFCLRCIL